MARFVLLAGLALSCAGLSCSDGGDHDDDDAGSHQALPVTGRVLDDTGDAVAGAEVILTLHAFTDFSRFEELDPVLSDAEGRFSFPPSAGYAVAEARAEGYEAWYGASFMVETDDPPEDLVLVLARPRILSGQVIGFSGEGHACWLNLEPQPPEQLFGLPDSSLDTLEPAQKLVQRNTEDDGRFAFPLPPCVWKLTVMLEGVPAETRIVTLDDAPLDIRLGRQGQVHGVVRGAEGQPLANAMVSVTRPDNGDWKWETIQTNAHGEYLFGAYPYSARPHLVVAAPGHAVWARELDPSEAASSRYDVDLEVGHAIRGRLLGKSGGPVSDCLITVHGTRRLELDHGLYHLPTTWEWHAGIAWARTDENGTFAFDRLYAGEFEVLAHPDGPPEIGCMTRVESGREGVVLRLGQGLDLRPRLRGVLRRGDFDLPVPGAVLELTQRFDAGSRAEWRAAIDPETGRFDLSGLDAAPSTLTAEAPYHATARWEWSVEDLPRTPLALVLYRLQDLKVIVRDADGGIVRYPRVTARDASSAHYTGRALPMPRVDDVSLVQGLPATRCVLTIAHPDDAGDAPGGAPTASVEVEVDLRRPRERPLEVDLPWRNKVAGAAERTTD